MSKTKTGTFTAGTLRKNLKEHLNVLLQGIMHFVTLELAGHTRRRNIASIMVGILSRRQLLQNHLIIN